TTTRPCSSALPSLAPRCRSQQSAAFLRRGVEDAHAIGSVGRWDVIRVDERRAVDGVWKVGHAVCANARGELERCCLLCGAALAAQSARWLQRLTGVDRSRELRGSDVDGEVEVARRVRVWEVRNAVRAHALSELHRLLSLR